MKETVRPFKIQGGRRDTAMRHILATVILGAVLAATAAAAFADERSGGVYVSDRRAGISLSTQTIWKMPVKTTADHLVFDNK